MQKQTLQAGQCRYGGWNATMQLVSIQPQIPQVSQGRYTIWYLTCQIHVFKYINTSLYRNILILELYKMKTVVSSKRNTIVYLSMLYKKKL